MGKIDFGLSEDLLEKIVGQEKLHEFREWGENIQERLPLSPFYQQVMLLRGMSVQQLERELEEVTTVNKPQMIYLNSLNGDGLEDNPAFTIDTKELPKVLRCNRREFSYYSRDGKIVRKGEENLCEFFDELEEFTNHELAVMSGQILGVTMSHCDGLHEDFRKLLQNFDSRGTTLTRNVRDYLNLVKRVAKKKETPRVSGFVQLTCDLISEKGLDEYFGLRIERAKALGKINSKLSRAYFGYNLLIQQSIDRICNYEPTFREFPLQLDTVPQFIAKDNQLYNEMVSSFKVRPENRIYAPKKDKTVEESPKIEEPSQEKPAYSPTPQDLLRNAIINGHESYFSRDTLLRVEYFAHEDAVSYNGQIDNLAEAFSKFKLGKRMRNRESRPDELQLRNFFDDIKLGYAISGKVPSQKDLTRLYEENCSVKP